MQQWAWLLKKLAGALVTLWVVLTLTFGLVRLLPGGPFSNPKVSPQVERQLQARYHLNEPIYKQYLFYMAGLAQGNWGPSMVNEGRPVRAIIGEALGVSLTLGAWAALVGIGLGVLLACLHQLLPPVFAFKPTQTTLELIGQLALSTPTFVASGLLILLFSLKLGWFPATLQTGFQSGQGLKPQSWVLPVAALALGPLATTFWLVKTRLQETLQAPYLLSKRSFGLPLSRMLWPHLLRPSLLPLVALMGPLLANLLTGSFAVETIFAVPGLGRAFVFSVLNRDYTLLMGLTLVYGLLLVSLTTLSDLALSWLDPRLQNRLGGGKTA